MIVNEYLPLQKSMYFLNPQSVSFFPPTHPLLNGIKFTGINGRAVTAPLYRRQSATLFVAALEIHILLPERNCIATGTILRVSLY